MVFFAIVADPHFDFLIAVFYLIGIHTYIDEKIGARVWFLRKNIPNLIPDKAGTPS